MFPPDQQEDGLREFKGRDVAKFIHNQKIKDGYMLALTSLEKLTETSSSSSSSVDQIKAAKNFLYYISELMLAIQSYRVECRIHYISADDKTKIYTALAREYAPLKSKEALKGKVILPKVQAIMTVTLDIASGGRVLRKAMGRLKEYYKFWQFCKSLELSEQQRSPIDPFEILRANNFLISEDIKYFFGSLVDDRLEMSDAQSSEYTEARQVVAGFFKSMAQGMVRKNNLSLPQKFKQYLLLHPAEVAYREIRELEGGYGSESLPKDVMLAITQRRVKVLAYCDQFITGCDRYLNQPDSLSDLSNFVKQCKEQTEDISRTLCKELQDIGNIDIPSTKYDYPSFEEYLTPCVIDNFIAGQISSLSTIRARLLAFLTQAHDMNGDEQYDSIVSVIRSLVGPEETLTDEGKKLLANPNNYHAIMALIAIDQVIDIATGLRREVLRNSEGIDYRGVNSVIETLNYLKVQHKKTHPWRPWRRTDEFLEALTHIHPEKPIQEQILRPDPMKDFNMSCSVRAEMVKAEKVVHEKIKGMKEESGFRKMPGRMLPEDGSEQLSYERTQIILFVQWVCEELEVVINNKADYISNAKNKAREMGLLDKRVDGERLTDESFMTVSELLDFLKEKDMESISDRYSQISPKKLRMIVMDYLQADSCQKFLLEKKLELAKIDQQLLSYASKHKYSKLDSDGWRVLVGKLSTENLDSVELTSEEKSTLSDPDCYRAMMALSAVAQVLDIDSDPKQLKKGMGYREINSVIEILQAYQKDHSQRRHWWWPFSRDDGFIQALSPVDYKKPIRQQVYQKNRQLNMSAAVRHCMSSIESKLQDLGVRPGQNYWFKKPPIVLLEKGSEYPDTQVALFFSELSERLQQAKPEGRAEVLRVGAERANKIGIQDEILGKDGTGAAMNTNSLLSMLVGPVHEWGFISSPAHSVRPIIAHLSDVYKNEARKNSPDLQNGDAAAVLEIGGVGSDNRSDESAEEGKSAEDLRAVGKQRDRASSEALINSGGVISEGRGSRDVAPACSAKNTRSQSFG